MSWFPRLATARLLLRQETLEDAEAVFAVFSDPNVTQFHDLDTFMNVEQAVGVIKRRVKRFEDGRGIRWGIVCKRDGLIGSCGLTWDKQAYSAELGYELARPFWRQGIMTEALEAILQFGFEAMNLRLVTAEVVLGNIASRNEGYLTTSIKYWDSLEVEQGDDLARLLAIRVIKNW